MRDLHSSATWEHLGEAQGDILVPPGKELRLLVTSDDLSPLAAIQPDALHTLDLMTAYLLPITEPKPAPAFYFYPPIKDSQLAHVARLAELEDLSIAAYNVTDTGMKYLSALTNLKQLSLIEAEQVTDAGISHLSTLTWLEVLSISGALQVRDAGMVHLRPLRRLKKLNLAGTRVTDEGLMHLARLTVLEELDLWGTDVTGAGLAHLTGLPRLRLLNLPESSVTSADLVHISRLTSLESLYLWKTEVSDEGLVLPFGAWPFDVPQFG